MSLLSNLGKKGVDLGLLTQRIDIEDNDGLSRYFGFAELPTVFTAGKNAIAFHGSPLLADKSEIFIECLDSNGQPLYLELAKSRGIYFSDVAKFVVSLHVYDEVANGTGKLILVGTAVNGETVRWIKNITIDKTQKNESKVRFWDKPTLEVRSLLYPVVDLTLVSEIFPPPVYRVPSAIAHITNVLDRIQVYDGGAGYTFPPSVNIVGGLGANASSASAVAVLTGTSVGYVIVSNRGQGFTSTPSIVISPPSMTGNSPIIPSQAQATGLLTGVVGSVTITDGGEGYNLDTPMVTAIGGGGTGFTATSTVVAGSVTGLTITNNGRDFTSTPDLTFTFPQKPTPPNLNLPATLTAQFHTYSPYPKIGTFVRSIKNQKPIDYRLQATLPFDSYSTTLTPTSSFNNQMEGKEITLMISKVRDPFSYLEINVNVTQSFTIEKVLSVDTLQLNEPYYVELKGGDKVVAEIIDGTFSCTYNFVKYNTTKESNLRYAPDEHTTPVDVRKSYAEITYRNLKTFSGYVARHKLYRRSLFYPGDFQLISDEPLAAKELLFDQVTFNKAYSNVGKFYHQIHLEKYWFTSSADIKVEAKNTPLNSMMVSASSYNVFDDSNYLIAKMDSIGVVNTSTYIPYDTGEFNALSGSSYNSNFISLKKNSLYALSLESTIFKDSSDPTAKVSFYFKSSVSGIENEKDYNSTYGLKIGELAVPEAVVTKSFDGVQTLYFTPLEDYFGTLVIVPYRCFVNLSEMSLKIYADAGFSPDVLQVQTPFLINCQNEAFELKSELFDKDANVVFSDLKTTHIFDPAGDSLKVPLGQSSDGGTILVGGPLNGGTTVNTVTNFTVTGDLWLPNLDPDAGYPKRFVAWTPPSGSNASGSLIYTNVSNLVIDRNDYISLTSVDFGTTRTVKSLAVAYDGANIVGRKIIIHLDGTKIVYPLNI